MVMAAADADRKLLIPPSQHKPRQATTFVVWSFGGSEQRKEAETATVSCGQSME